MIATVLNCTAVYNNGRLSPSPSLLPATGRLSPSLLSPSSLSPISLLPLSFQLLEWSRLPLQSIGVDRSEFMRCSTGSIPFITLSFYQLSFPAIPCCIGITLVGLLKHHHLIEDNLSTVALLILHIWQHRINPATGISSREAMMLEALQPHSEETLLTSRRGDRVQWVPVSVVPPSWCCYLPHHHLFDASDISEDVAPSTVVPVQSATSAAEESSLVVLTPA